jgi:hypothetical protein
MSHIAKVARALWELARVPATPFTHCFPRRVALITRTAVLAPATLAALPSTRRGFALITRTAPVLAPATLAALQSTRAIETRLLPSSLAATHRGFAFYVAFPKRSIP